MALPHYELLKLNPSYIIELFKIELVEGLHYATGNPSSVPTTYRFHSGTKIDSYADIVWQSNTYEKLPIEVKGFEYSGKGQIPRPQLLISNLGGITRSGAALRVTDLLATVNSITAQNDLLNAKVTRIKTTADNLDAANFTGGSNPYGTPSSDQFPQEIYFIDRKHTESFDVVHFELVSALDLHNLRLPKRQVTRQDFEGVGTFVN